MYILNLSFFFLFPYLLFAATISKNFSSNLTILPVIVITETNAMTPPPEQTGQTKDVVIDPNSSYAASFNVVGAPNRNFTKSVVQTSVIIKTGTGVGNTRRITVDSFTFSGPTSFDGSGNALGVKVGATYHLQPDDIIGDYTAAATLRIVYL